MQQSKLLVRRDIDSIDELEVTWRNAYTELQKSLTSASEQETNNALQTKVAESTDKHNEIVLGLVYSVLTTAQTSAQHFRYLSLVVRDGFAFAVISLKRLIIDKYPKLQDTCRRQLIWILQELIKLKVHDVDNLCSALLRHIAGGDLNPKNIALTNAVLKLFLDHKQWLHTSARLIPVAFYTFLRLVADHNKPQFAALRQQEVMFCSTLWREKFEECKVIGRDVVRLFQEVNKIPEFEAIWKDLLHKPTAFSPTFTGLNELLALKTPHKYLVSRLTPDMESQLLFVLKQVRMGSQKRYQTWFMQKYLTVPENESLISDLIRYICGVYHPPNSVLCSDIVPRWAIIGWLLKCVKTKYMQANAKLALFYDWLFFDPKTDNIMNIEPAILLMMHSIPKYADITCMLVEFLVQVIDTYDEPRRELVRKGIHHSLATLLSKGVINSLAPIYGCPNLDPGIKKKLQSIFRPFLKMEEESIKQKNSGKVPPHGQGTSQGPSMPPQAGQPSAPAMPQSKSQELPSPEIKSPKKTDNFDGENRKFKPEQQDQYDMLLSDKPLMELTSSVSGRRNSQSVSTEEPIKTERPESPEPFIEEPDFDKDIKLPSDMPPSLTMVGPSIVKFTESLGPDQSEPYGTQLGLLKAVLANLVKMSSSGRTHAETPHDLAVFLANSFNKEFSDTSMQSVFCSTPNLYHALFFAKPSRPSTPMLDLLCEMRSLVPSIGYRFMAWLLMTALKDLEQMHRRRKGNQSKQPKFRDGGDEVDKEGMEDEEGNVQEPEWHNLAEQSFRYLPFLSYDFLQPYVTFIEYVSKRRPKSPDGSDGSSERDNPFYSDWEVCANENSDAFIRLVPYLYRYLSQLIEPCRFNFLNLVVTNSDPTHIQSLVCKLSLGEFEMFATRASSLIAQTLDWESVDQFCTWQLLNAEYSQQATDQIHAFLSEVLPLAHAHERSEIIPGLLALLKSVQPTPPLVSTLLSTPKTLSSFAAALLKHWTHFDLPQLIEHLLTVATRLLDKFSASGNSRTDDAWEADPDNGGKFGRGQKRKTPERPDNADVATDGDARRARRLLRHFDIWLGSLRPDVNPRASRSADRREEIAALASTLLQLAPACGADVNNYPSLVHWTLDPALTSPEGSSFVTNRGLRTSGKSSPIGEGSSAWKKRPIGRSPDPKDGDGAQRHPAGKRRRTGPEEEGQEDSNEDHDPDAEAVARERERDESGVGVGDDPWGGPSVRRGPRSRGGAMPEEGSSSGSMGSYSNPHVSSGHHHPHQGSHHAATTLHGQGPLHPHTQQHASRSMAPHPQQQQQQQPRLRKSQAQVNGSPIPADEWRDDASTPVSSSGNPNPNPSAQLGHREGQMVAHGNPSVRATSPNKGPAAPVQRRTSLSNSLPATGRPRLATDPTMGYPPSDREDHPREVQRGGSSSETVGLHLNRSDEDPAGLKRKRKVKRIMDEGDSEA